MAMAQHLIPEIGGSSERVRPWFRQPESPNLPEFADKTIVVICPAPGERYLSSVLFQGLLGEQTASLIKIHR